MWYNKGLFKMINKEYLKSFIIDLDYSKYDSRLRWCHINYMLYENRFSCGCCRFRGKASNIAMVRPLCDYIHLLT